MNLFDFIDVFFTDKQAYIKISDYEKSKHFFMLNRMLSMKFPKQASFFNVNGMSPERIVDFWFNLVGAGKKQLRSKPNWVYTKTEKGNNKKTWYPKDKEILLKYLRFRRISEREFKEWLEVDDGYIKEEYLDFEEREK